MPDRHTISYAHRALRRQAAARPPLRRAQLSTLGGNAFIDPPVAAEPPRRHSAKNQWLIGTGLAVLLWQLPAALQGDGVAVALRGYPAADRIAAPTDMPRSIRHEPIVSPQVSRQSIRRLQAPARRGNGGIAAPANALSSPSIAISGESGARHGADTSSTETLGVTPEPLEVRHADAPLPDLLWFSDSAPGLAEAVPADQSVTSPIAQDRQYSAPTRLLNIPRLEEAPIALGEGVWSSADERTVLAYSAPSSGSKRGPDATASKVQIDQITQDAPHLAHVEQIPHAHADRTMLAIVPQLNEDELELWAAEMPAELPVRLTDRHLGSVPFRIGSDNAIEVQLGGLLGLVSQDMPAAELARLENSTAALEYVSLGELSEMGLPLTYNAAYDELRLQAS